MLRRLKEAIYGAIALYRRSNCPHMRYIHRQAFPMSDRKHSFPPVVAPDTRLLVLGSLPGERSLAAARYYAHPQNQFWQLISPAAGRDLVPLPYPERLEALLAARIGLWDVVASATRPGSTDAALRDIEPHDIAALAATLSDLRALAFNGATAQRHGLRQLGDAAKRYTILGLPSSSPLHTIGFAAKAPAWAALSAFSQPHNGANA
jgi:hypoxanthine-DNA glycosylase